jgi:SAM-dependent methyltransferase
MFRFSYLGLSRFLLTEALRAAMEGDTITLSVERGQNLRKNGQTIDHVQAINDQWRQSRYYDDAESAEWVGGFWNESKTFERMFRTLDRRVLVELACGHGRHTAFLLRQPAYTDTGRIYLLDVNEENVEFCRTRFAGIPAVAVYRNSGHDFRPVGDGEATAIFCYDSMVHFEYGTVISYIKDAMRILVPGGRALFHHSNYDKAPGNSYRDNPDWRNFMSKALFAHVAMRSGFTVIEQVVFDWATPESDCLTLLERQG